MSLNSDLMTKRLLLRCVVFCVLLEIDQQSDRYVYVNAGRSSKACFCQWRSLAWTFSAQVQALLLGQPRLYL